MISTGGSLSVSPNEAPANPFCGACLWFLEAAEKLNCNQREQAVHAECHGCLRILQKISKQFGSFSGATPFFKCCESHQDNDEHLFRSLSKSSKKNNGILLQSASVHIDQLQMCFLCGVLDSPCESNADSWFTAD